MDTNAQLEGDDVLSERLRVFMYGDGFASIDGELAISAFGPRALQTIAKKLLAAGYDPDQKLDIHRGGQRLNRIRLRDAAHEPLET
ncbi:MAG: hypothetical protein C5B58_13700 [Acidobacteria bacterium]|nr:MAG: hypothetical protein C5B58_13700 [Acidobacteriota bacterium]